jgi:hypothetical protein
MCLRYHLCFNICFVLAEFVLKFIAVRCDDVCCARYGDKLCHLFLPYNSPGRKRLVPVCS